MLLVGMLVVSCMSIGLLFLKIEVDPVRIWSNPESRTGQEKAHFDENFSPYHRMSQVILNAEGLLPVCPIHLITHSSFLDPDQFQSTFLLL